MLRRLLLGIEEHPLVELSFRIAALSDCFELSLKQVVCTLHRMWLRVWDRIGIFPGIHHEEWMGKVMRLGTWDRNLHFCQYRGSFSVHDTWQIDFSDHVEGLSIAFKQMVLVHYRREMPLMIFLA